MRKKFAQKDFQIRKLVCISARCNDEWQLMSYLFVCLFCVCACKTFAALTKLIVALFNWISLNFNHVIFFTRFSFLTKLHTISRATNLNNFFRSQRQFRDQVQHVKRHLPALQTVTTPFKLQATRTIAVQFAKLVNFYVTKEKQTLRLTKIPPKIP